MRVDGPAAPKQRARVVDRGKRSPKPALHAEPLAADEFPEYDEPDQVRITALLRCLFSVQNWLRMREEFGVPGTESGPVLAWAVDVLLKEIRAGNFPRRAPNK